MATTLVVVRNKSDAGCSLDGFLDLELVDSSRVATSEHAHHRDAVALGVDLAPGALAFGQLIWTWRVESGEASAAYDQAVVTLDGEPIAISGRCFSQFAVVPGSLTVGETRRADDPAARSELGNVTEPDSELTCR